MRIWFALVTAVAFGCGNSGSGTDTDGGAGDGDGGGSDVDAPSGARTVKLTLTNRPNNAAPFSFLVMVQDGAAPWQVAPAPTGDTYSFTINAPSYGVAYACISGTAGTQQRSVTSAHFAVGERTELTLDVPARCSDRQMGGVTLSGNVSNRPIGGVIVVQYAGRSTFAGGQSGNFTLQVPPGTHDLVVAHAVPQGNGDFYVDEVVVQRNLAISANMQKSINFFDSVSAESFDVNVDAAPDMARVVASTTLYTDNGTNASLVREAKGSFGTLASVALGEDDRLDSDVYDQSIAVSNVGGGATITHATNKPESQTYEPPAPLGTAMTTIPTKQPYITLQTTWPSYSNAIGYTWTASQQAPCSGSNNLCSTVWTSFLSPGVVGTMPAYRMPDFAMVPGWKDAYAFASSDGIVGSVTAITSTAGAGDFPTGVPANGTDRTFVRSDFVASP